MQNFYIPFLILISFVATPIFSPTGFYLVYLWITGKLKPYDKKLKYAKNLRIFFSIIIFTLTFSLCNCLECSFNIMSIFIMICILILLRIIGLFSVNFWNSDSFTGIIPCKIDITSVFFNILLFLLLFLSLFNINSKVNEIKNQISTTIPSHIENYAKDNNYIIFSNKDAKLIEYSNASIENEWLIHNSPSHYFFIEENSKKNTIFVYNKEDPTKSFNVDYLTLENEDLLKTTYSEIIDNFYVGSNYTKICYLLNENDAKIIYALAKKDDITNKFYIEKYVMFNMTTGEFSYFN